MPAQKSKHQKPLGYLDAWLITKSDKHLTQSAPEITKRSDDYIISAYYLTIYSDEMKEMTKDVKFKCIVLQGYFSFVQTAHTPPPPPAKIAFLSAEEMQWKGFDSSN